MNKKGHYNMGYEHTEAPSVFVISDRNQTDVTNQNGTMGLATAQNAAKTLQQDEGHTEPEEGASRDQWNNQIEFLLACVSMSVGLGNVWRFPYVAYENGGGAFLIPYLIVLFLIGKPLYFMELAFGQFSSYGAVKAWKCVPLLKGIGYGQAVSTFYVATYYNYLMAICVFYFVQCFQKILPWTKCDGDWTDENCYEPCVNTTGNCSKNAIKGNQTAAEQYYNKHVLVVNDGLEDSFGFPDWRLALCLLFCWVVLFFVFIRGVKSSGKTTYFTAIFPYVILVTLLVLGCTLEGAVDGIIYFVKPDWEKLKTGKVWYEACQQSFFSLAVGFGNLTMFSSYNPFRHNVYRDAMIVSILDMITSLLAGFTVFAILGSMAFQQGVGVQDVVTSGEGLAFMAYPQALAQLDFVPQLWTVLFFLMLFTLGIGSSVSQVGNVLTVITDQFPNVPKWKFGLGICVVCYLLGLLYITPGGPYIQILVDKYGAGFTIFIFAVLQAVAIMWIYGMRNFVQDIEFMLERKISYYWKVCWMFIVPIGLAVIFVYALVTLEPPTKGSYTYPTWSLYIGWMLAAIAVGQVPIWAVHTVFKQKGDNIWEKFKMSLRPTADWGPRRPKDRMEWGMQKPRLHEQ